MLLLQSAVVAAIVVACVRNFYISTIAFSAVAMLVVAIAVCNFADECCYAVVEVERIDLPAIAPAVKTTRSKTPLLSMLAAFGLLGFASHMQRDRMPGSKAFAMLSSALYDWLGVCWVLK